MICAAAGHTELCQKFIDLGAAIDATSSYQNRTALMVAAYFAQPETAKLLIESGAALDVIDNQDNTVLDLARNTDLPQRDQKKQRDTVTLLSEAVNRPN